MDTEIDMKSLTGADFGPAAGDNQVDHNSYQETASEYPEHGYAEAPSHERSDGNSALDINPQRENFRALRDEVDRMKAERESERREYQLQMELLRANIANKGQQESPKPERKFLEGMEESDIPNVAELRKEWEARESNYVARLEELQVAQQHPDYAEVIEKYALPLVKAKPHLAEGIQGATNKALFAYELGKMAQQMQAPQVQAQRSEKAERIIENSKKPGTLSQAGGQGALSKADYYATMSDQEFMKFANRHLEGI